MFTYSYDEPSGVSVGIMSGGENTDDDYARYVALITSPVLAGKVVDRDNPAPNAEWRRKIAAASSGYTHRPVFAMITASPFIRGVSTAINWIRPPPTIWPPSRNSTLPYAGRRSFAGSRCRAHIDA